MTVVSISHARENLFPLVRQVNEDHVVIEIVARNGGNAVLMSAEGYESLQETLYLFSTRANAVHILRGLAEARDGAAQRPNWRRWPPGSACRQTGETVHRLGCPRRTRGLVHDQPKVLSKIIRLIAETTRTPRSGNGKPERLKHLGGEVWSRRTTEKDRFVYDIQSDAVTIIACRFHYDDH